MPFQLRRLFPDKQLLFRSYFGRCFFHLNEKVDRCIRIYASFTINNHTMMQFEHYFSLVMMLSNLGVVQHQKDPMLPVLYQYDFHAQG